MKTNETIIASYTATRPCPTLAKSWSLPRAAIKATAEAYHIHPNKHPHFSVTGEVIGPRTRDCTDGIYMCGCIHEEVTKYFPRLVPLIKMHGSNADDGAPSHAVENGFYYLTGAVENHFGHEHINPHFGYYGQKSNHSKEISPEECLKTCAEHLRVSVPDMEAITALCLEAFKAGCDTVASSEHVTPTAEKERCKAGMARAKQVFADYCETLRPQWQNECNEALVLIATLNAEQEARRAKEASNTPAE